MSYLDYWGLTKDPFDGIPDRGSYANSAPTGEAQPLASTALVRGYVSSRLLDSGCRESVFEEDTYSALWVCSRGIPTLIDRICVLSMKAAESSQMRKVSAHMIHEAADRFRQEGEGGDRTSQPRDQKAVWPGSQVPPADRIVVDQPQPPDLPGEAVHPCAPDRERISTTGQQPAPSKDETPAQGTTAEEEKWQLPEQFLERLFRMDDTKSRLRFAGQLAAKELLDHPYRYRSCNVDPVQIWDELRKEIVEAAHILAIRKGW